MLDGGAALWEGGPRRGLGVWAAAFRTPVSGGSVHRVVCFHCRTEPVFKAAVVSSPK